MGNNESKEKTPEEKCKERAKELIEEYYKSREVPVTNFLRNGGTLRSGDILSRRLDGSGSSQSSGRYGSGSYSGPTLTLNGGLFIHYAIYYRSIGDDKHQLIEKCDTRDWVDPQDRKDGVFNNNDRKGTHVWIAEFTTDELKQYFRILIDSRYMGTCHIALEIYNRKLDAGYSFSHSNCEHFVTLCLTRHGHYSRSRQVAPITVTRDVVGFAPILVGQMGKLITHPFYMIGGDMNLDSRLLQTSLPFGLDSDEIVNGIKDGSKIFIGYCFRNIPEPWFDH